MHQATMYQASELCGVTHSSTYTFNFFDSQDPLYLEDHSPRYLASLSLGTGMLDIDLSEHGFSISEQWGSGIQHCILGCGLMRKGKEERKLGDRWGDENWNSILGASLAAETNVHIPIVIEESCKHVSFKLISGNVPQETSSVQRVFAKYHDHHVLSALAPE